MIKRYRLTLATLAVVAVLTAALAIAHDFSIVVGGFFAAAILVALQGEWSDR